MKLSIFSFLTTLSEIKDIFADRDGEKCFMNHVLLVAKRIIKIIKCSSRNALSLSQRLRCKLWGKMRIYKYIVKFLKDEPKYRKKTSKNISRYFYSSFRCHVQQSLMFNESIWYLALLKGLKLEKFTVKLK